SVSVTLILTAGNYTIGFSAFSTDGGAIRPVRYVLRGIVLSSPIGPQAEDPTAQPSQQPPPPSSSGSTSATSSSPPPSAPPPPSSDPSSSWYSWYSPDGSTTYGGPSSQDPSGSGFNA